jgi:hypothetical protein
MGTEERRPLRGGEAISRRDILQVGTASAGLAGASAFALGPATASAQQFAPNTAPTPTAPADNRPVRTGEQQPFYDSVGAWSFAGRCARFRATNMRGRKDAGTA